MPDSPTRGTASAAPVSRWSLSPLIWSPLAIVLVSVIAGLGIAYANKQAGLVVTTVRCEVGEPGCELRQKQHWHADFALVIRGETFDLDEERFISGENTEKSDAVHIHDPRHAVVHVHLERTTWQEFFGSIGFRLEGPAMGEEGESTLTLPGGEVLRNTPTETLKFFVNGVSVGSVVGLNIGELDRLLVSYGHETVEEARAQFETLSNQACIPSLLCLDRLPPGGLEDEPCSRGSECN